MPAGGGDGANGGDCGVVVCPAVSTRNRPSLTPLRKAGSDGFGMVCLQHPCPGRVAFVFPDGDYVSLFLFEILTASNDVRMGASVACVRDVHCTLA